MRVPPVIFGRSAKPIKDNKRSKTEHFERYGLKGTVLRRFVRFLQVERLSLFSNIKTDWDARPTENSSE
jgi:hypothetical protein